MVSRAPIRFVKMQGLGNDFVVVDPWSLGFQGVMTGELASAMADRRLGVGCDQVLWLAAPSEPARRSGAHFRMTIFNPDGSEAEMCGNGVRAAALHLKRRSPERLGASTEPLVFETLGGLVRVLTPSEENARVDMGLPRDIVTGLELRTRDGVRLIGDFVSMGNPHAVIWVGASSPWGCLEQVPFAILGPELERHQAFPNRANIEFVEFGEPGRLRAKVWERGAGATLACGTGACAAYVSYLLRNADAPNTGTVELPGGTLEIEWDRSPSSPVFMTGPARDVFFGEWISDPSGSAD